MTALEPQSGEQAYSGGGNTSQESLPTRLLRETEAMARYALASGIGITPAMVQAVEQAKVGAGDGSIAVIHGQLAKLVAPAKPGTIALFEDEAPTGSLTRILGPVRLIRQLMVVALAFLALFVVMASLMQVSVPAGAAKGVQAAAKDIQTARTTPVFILYLCTAAGLGAAFAALSRVNQFIADGTYDRVYDATYWILLVLGLIAGLILAMVIPINKAGQEPFSKPLLALLGGFSAGAVHRILTRVVSAIEALVEGDDRSNARARDREADAQVQTERTTVAATLVGVEHALANDPDQARTQLRELVAHLVPGAPSPPPVATGNGNGNGNGNGSMGAALPVSAPAA